MNRVSPTPFSAPLESSRSPEVDRPTKEEQKMFGRQVTLELKVIDGTPMVKTFEFAHSTFQQAAASKLM